MPYAEHFIIESIRFTAFAFVCGCLLQPRFKRRNTILIAVGFLLGILAIQAGLLIAGHDETLILTLLPVTAYIPAIIGVHVLSRSGFPQTVSVWSAGVLISFTLLFFQKLLGTAFVHTAVAVLIAAVVFSGLVFFFLRRPYRTYVLENQSGWLLMSFPTVMLFFAVFLLGQHGDGSDASAADLPDGFIGDWRHDLGIDFCGFSQADERDRTNGDDAAGKPTQGI